MFRECFVDAFRIFPERFLITSGQLSECFLDTLLMLWNSGRTYRLLLIWNTFRVPGMGISQRPIESPRAPLGIVAFPANPPTWQASLHFIYSLPIIIIIQQPSYKDARQKRGARAAFRAKLIMPALGDPPKIKMPGLWRVFYKGFNHASASVSRVKMPGNYRQARIIAEFAKQVWSCFHEPVLLPDRVRGSRRARQSKQKSKPKSKQKSKPESMRI